MIFHDIEQNTPEWEDLRCGKITGSNLGKIMANYGKAFGDPAKTYALQIALERITGETALHSFQNSHTQRGHEQEPLARMIYEDTYFLDVDNGGFFDCGKIGCSPDGRVGDNGIIEIKSVVANQHYANVKRGGFDPAYKWQVYGNLLYTESEWIDFISFCADYPVGKQIAVKRFYANDCQEEFRQIKLRVFEFEKLVAERIKEIQAS